MVFSLKYSIYLTISLVMMGLGVAAFILHFTNSSSGERYKGYRGFKGYIETAEGNMILSMPNCGTDNNSTMIWSKCMGNSPDPRKCVKVYKGDMPSGNTDTEGCWIKGPGKDGDKDLDPCMHFLEGGPSPDWVPKTCAKLCCTGGYYVEKQ